jgi:hypothetical protein
MCQEKKKTAQGEIMERITVNSMESDDSDNDDVINYNVMNVTILHNY